jgi:hypothetical protein
LVDDGLTIATLDPQARKVATQGGKQWKFSSKLF